MNWFIFSRIHNDANFHKVECRPIDRMLEGGGVAGAGRLVSIIGVICTTIESFCGADCVLRVTYAVCEKRSRSSALLCRL